MRKELTFDKFIELPDLIIETAKKTTLNDLLTKETIKKYYYTNLRKEIEKYIDRFNDTKFTFNNVQGLTGKYNSEITNKKNQISDITLNMITNHIDSQIWSYDFYQSLISLSYKFTETEARYFIETFFCKHKEENTALTIGTCRTTLQKIKRSCLVKIYLELKYNNQLNLYFSK